MVCNWGKGWRIGLWVGRDRGVGLVLWSGEFWSVKGLVLVWKRCRVGCGWGVWCLKWWRWLLRVDMGMKRGGMSMKGGGDIGRKVER